MLINIGIIRRPVGTILKPIIARNSPFLPGKTSFPKAYPAETETSRIPSTVVIVTKIELKKYEKRKIYCRMNLQKLLEFLVRL